MGIRILLVEDDEHICNTVKTFLSEAGYKVDACIDGEEAYNKFLIIVTSFSFSTLCCPVCADMSFYGNFAN